MSDQAFICSNTLMPFGKYAGRPLSDVVADRWYVLWVISQEELCAKYPELAGFMRKEAARILVDWERS
jgi:uncharacterized protein (DUF3820 family)